MERTEVAEIEAQRSLFAAAPADVAEELGIGFLELDEAIAGRVSFLSGAPEVNHALGITAPGQLDAIARFYGPTGHVVSPAPGVDLDSALRERGYEPGYAWMKFTRGVELQPSVSTKLEVVGAGPEQREDFGRTAAEGSGMPKRFRTLAGTASRAGGLALLHRL